MKRIKYLLVSIVLQLAVTNTLYACGPCFDDAYLVRGSKDQFLSMPKANFYKEIDRMFGFSEGNKESNKETPKTDLQELSPAYSAYKAGREALEKDEYVTAIRYFKEVKYLINESGKENDALNKKCIGWQARAEYKNGDFITSIHHYIEIKDTESIFIVSKILSGADQETINTAMQDSIVRKIILAWAVSDACDDFSLGNEDKKERLDKILIALEGISENEKNENADKIALIFYNNGDFDNTTRWLEIAKENSPITIWLEAKLYIMNGNIDQTLAKMKELLPYLEKERNNNSLLYLGGNDYLRKTIYSEIGVLALRQEDYLSAFDMFAKGKCWEDIAYMAERVLTPDELEQYINEHPKDMLGFNKSYEWVNITSISDALKYLLARRYMRMGQWQSAIDIMPESIEIAEYDYDTESYKEKRDENLLLIKTQMQSFYNYLIQAENKESPLNKRAQNYYQAAKIMRKYGMEMSGTELDPDWFYFEGAYYWDDCLENRFAILSMAREIDDTRDLNGYESWWGKGILKHHISLSKRRKEIKAYRDFFTGSEDEEMSAAF